MRAACLPALAATLTLATWTWAQTPRRGLSEAPALAAAYDAILDADFAAASARLAPACATVPALCQVMEAVSLWWRIQLDPDDRAHDRRFSDQVQRAIRESEQWTAAEPDRAEAWFARGATYGARAQWRVLRGERLSAARDGKRIKEALERALALDPDLHDARFGIGMYRYYADVAPAALRMLRWLLLLPGGNRVEGLAQMIDARNRGVIVRGEADYQLHTVFLWYERRFSEALTLVQGLGRRHPHSPLFAIVEAEIHEVYFHDRVAAAATLQRLIARAARGEIHEAAVARRRAERALARLTARAPR